VTLLSEQIWEWARVLVIGAILAKGRTNGDSDRASHGPAERTTISAFLSGAQPRHVDDSSP